MLSRRLRKNILAAALYISCLSLVVVYANLFSLYRSLNASLGNDFTRWSPIVILLFFVSGLLYLFYRAVKTRKAKIKEHWGWFAGGVGLLIFAMFIPDPQLGVKRIHVTEYLLLSLLVRFTLSLHLGGTTLLIYSCLLTALLGIHDEFLQGLHPSRTYGLKDMLVNSVAGLGGSLIWHSIHFFEKTSKACGQESLKWKNVEWFFLFWLVFSVLALAVPMVAYLYSPVPLWLFLPLTATLVFWSCYGSRMNQINQPGVHYLTASCFLFLLYPVAIHVFKIPFY